MKALSRNRVIDYWPKAGEYGELKDYVLNDIDGVREAVMMLVGIGYYRKDKTHHCRIEVL